MMSAAAVARHGLLRAASQRMLLPAIATYRAPQSRWLSRKGSKMGRHLETLEELAHRPSHEQAKERRKAKKAHKKKQKAKEFTVEEDMIPDEVQFDEGDDHFEHCGEDDVPVLPNPADVKKRMLKVVDRITESFKAIRGSEPTPEMFDHIMVQAYGERTPLSAVAQVVITSSTLASITCYDPQVAPDVRNAVQLAMELNPQLEEDGVVTVKLPRPTAETRQKTVKQLGKQAESGRQRIRGIRRAAMEVVKKGKDGKLEHISKDDAFRVSKEIDGVTDDVIKQLNDEVEKKQASVMAV